MKKLKVYISGPLTDPITGKVMAKNVEAFLKAEELVKAHGYKDVVNPVRVWTCRWPWLYKLVGYRLTLFYDLWMLTNCNLIYKIPWWRDSMGANIESCVAYHFGVWTLPQKKKEAIDKKMNQFRGMET